MIDNYDLAEGLTQKYKNPPSEWLAESARGRGRGFYDGLYGFLRAVPLRVALSVALAFKRLL